MIRRRLAILAFCVLAVSANAASNEQTEAPGLRNTPDQVFADAMRQSVGAPAKADLGTVATVRLDDDLIVVPHDPAARLLKVYNKEAPPDLVALLLLTSQGMDLPGVIRSVASGYIDAGAALTWKAGDFLDSLRDTVEQANPDRQKRGLPEREARRWIRPPHYDPDAHTLSWAALITPKSAPHESDGEVVFYGLAFGRDGYIQLSIPTSVEQADEVGRTVDSFLHGVSFRPGWTYTEYRNGDPRAPNGLAGAMGIETLHKARDGNSVFSSDVLMAAAGSLVAVVGGVSLFFYVQRHLRRIARRV